MPADRPDDSPIADWQLGSDLSTESLRLSRSVSRRGRSGSRTPRDVVMDFEAPGCPAEDRDSSLDTCLFHGGEAETGVPSSRCSDAVPVLPRPGEEVGGFRLISELGRGAFARVFLAEEVSLGGRRVALKVSPAEGDEPQILARLQHAHIVPVHSVHDDPDTGLRLLCMPYLGGANLAEVLEEAHARRDGEAGRSSLITALDRLSRRLPPVGSERPISGRRGSHRSRPRDGGSVRLDPPETGPRPASCRASIVRPSHRFAPLRWMLDGSASEANPDQLEDDFLPARKLLRRADPIRAAVWVVARLAEGLEHAHSRGLLHRDLKPSNVLIAADCTPMLLDFNLSVEAPTNDEESDESIARAMLGGTLPYMAPEHLDALDPQGSTPPDAVDERSDVYALGLILFEMIAGEPAFTTPEGVGGSLPLLRRMLAERRLGAPSLRSRVPEVPPSLDALAAKCLAPEPGRRYAGAGDLAEDLRRFLEDRPMKHGPEPSLAELARKWSRRHPAACSSTSTACAAVFVLGLLVVMGYQIFQATEALHARLMLRKFQRDAQECRFLLNASDDGDRLRRGLVLAPATLAAIGVDEATGILGGPWIGRLETSERSSVRESIVDLILEDAHARVAEARFQGSEPRLRLALESAVARLDRLAARLPDPPSVLFRQSSRYRAALGDADGSERDSREADARPPKTSRDWTSLGMFHFAVDDLTAAEQALRKALALDFTSFWAWFALGHCHYEQARFSEAAADFTACAVARPDFAWGHFNRGLALTRAGRPREAIEAYSRALALDPGFQEARVDRGLVALQVNEPAKAEADLRTAIIKGRREPHVVAALADALSRQGKTSEAERLLDEVLAHSPSPDLRAARGVVRLRTDPAKAAADFNAVLGEDEKHPLAHYGLARVLRSHDRAAALRHLDRAIAVDPSFSDAVEMRAVERARVGNRAALDDVERLVARPTAGGLYNAACALALLGEDGRAIELLGRAMAYGFSRAQAAADPDLAPLRKHPGFARALERTSTAR